MELGPSSVNSKIELVHNDYSWNSNASVIFLDQPVNVGYSYSGSSVSDTVVGLTSCSERSEAVTAAIAPTAESSTTTSRVGRRRSTLVIILTSGGSGRPCFERSPGRFARKSLKLHKYGRHRRAAVRSSPIIEVLPKSLRRTERHGGPTRACRSSGANLAEARRAKADRGFQPRARQLTP